MADPRPDPNPPLPPYELRIEVYDNGREVLQFRENTSGPGIWAPVPRVKV